MLDSLCAPAFLMDPLRRYHRRQPRALLAFHDLNLAQLQAVRTTAAGANSIAFLLAPGGAIARDAGARVAAHRPGQYAAMAGHDTALPAHCPLPAAFQRPVRLSRLLRFVGRQPRGRLRRLQPPAKLFLLTRSAWARWRTLSSPIPSVSAYGELYLSTFVPQDRVTTVLFQELAGKGGQAQSLAPWPNPSLD